MSIETPKVEESAPIITKPVDTTTIPAETSTPATTQAASTLPPVEPAIQPAEPIVPVETAHNEAIVTAVPATEGVLGYKGAPGLLNKFRFVKHFFWFSEEPLSQEGVDAYIKNEKAEIAHHNAAWAQETGKAVLFYAKRAEDKATPSGLILLAEATSVTRIGSTDFSFKVGSHTHKFEAASSQEQDSWVVAIEKIVEESKELKAEITGRESYKKTIEGFSFSPAIAGSTTPMKSDTPKKSLDATTATNAAVADPIVKADTSSESSSDEHKKNKEAEKQAKKDAKKERSQSRKRSSVFGLFGKKEEEKEIKKEEKKEEKAEKKAEKEHAKELKKLEAEQKKEEAKAEHDAAKAKEAAEAAAVAAAPAAVAASVVKKEEKHHDSSIDDATAPVTSPTEKKNKRASVFGGFFGAKNKVTSPSVEKTEKEVTPEVPAQEEVPVVSTVSETAPRLEEPIDHKPIDTAAVTAPVDAADSSVVPITTETKPIEPVAVTDSTPKTEKKSFFSGLIKKQEKKEEVKEEKTNEEAVKEVTPVAAPEPVAESAPVVAEPAVETPVKDVEAPKEERPAREKRRTSLFGSLGTLKRKTDKSPEPSSTAAVSEDAKSPEVKREKSPLPAKLGGLFRKPSKSAKDILAVPEEGKSETAHTTDAIKTHDTPLTTSEHDTPANATVIEHTGDSKIIGDVIPSDLHTTVHDAVTSAPETTMTTKTTV